MNYSFFLLLFSATSWMNLQGMRTQKISYNPILQCAMPPIDFGQLENREIKVNLIELGEEIYHKYNQVDVETPENSSKKLKFYKAINQRPNTKPLFYNKKK